MAVETPTPSFFMSHEISRVIPPLFDSTPAFPASNVSSGFEPPMLPSFALPGLMIPMLLIGIGWQGNQSLL